MTGLLLPALLQRPLEVFANGFVQPKDDPPVDFSGPVGEPALLPSDSLSWLVFKNPLALAIGGIAAVILELAEPRVRTGVWEHTSFRAAPLPRLQRTALAAMTTVYGPRSRAEAMIAGVHRLHRQVHGVTPHGDAYRADDPELLTWVQATATFGFLQAFNTYVRELDAEERDRLYAEGTVSAKLYGASQAPSSQSELDALFDAMGEKLEPSDIVFEFLDIMQRAPILPLWLQPLQRMLVKAAVGITPPWVRERLQLREEQWRLAAWQRGLLRAAGACADRLILRDSPAVQSCRRLGLAQDYLYRRKNRARRRTTS